MEVCKVGGGGGGGCEGQYQNEKMVSTASFTVLEWLPKKGIYLPRIPKVISDHGIYYFPGISHFPFNLSIASEIWAVLYPLPYQVQYVLYSLWSSE